MFVRGDLDHVFSRFAAAKLDADIHVSAEPCPELPLPAAAGVGGLIPEARCGGFIEHMQDHDLNAGAGEQPDGLADRRG